MAASRRYACPLLLGIIFSLLLSAVTVFCGLEERDHSELGQPHGLQAATDVQPLSGAGAASVVIDHADGHHEVNSCGDGLAASAMSVIMRSEFIPTAAVSGQVHNSVSISPGLPASTSAPFVSTPHLLCVLRT